MNCGGWLPHSHEWCAAMAAVQAEERERINKFFFQRDAKLALVSKQTVMTMPLLISSN